MSYASSWILLHLIIIPQPRPHYGFLELNKHRGMVVKENEGVGGVQDAHERTLIHLLRTSSHQA